jgi:hypothetical protein
MNFTVLQKQKKNKTVRRTTVSLYTLTSSLYNAYIAFYGTSLMQLKTFSFLLYRHPPFYRVHRLIRQQQYEKAKEKIYLYTEKNILAVPAKWKTANI